MFADAGLPVMVGDTHIVPLMVGDPVKAKRISDILLAEYGVYVQPINYPTVPARHRAAALHARPGARRSDDARTDAGAGRNLGPPRTEDGGLISGTHSLNPGNNPRPLRRSGNPSCRRDISGPSRRRRSASPPPSCRRASKRSPSAVTVPSKLPLLSRSHWLTIVTPPPGLARTSSTMPSTPIHLPT